MMVPSRLAQGLLSGLTPTAYMTERLQPVKSNAAVTVPESVPL